MAEGKTAKRPYVSGGAAAKANAKYKREKMTQLAIRFTNSTDADIIEKLNSVPNKRQYIIGLIRDDIARGQK